MEILQQAFSFFYTFLLTLSSAFFGYLWIQSHFRVKPELSDTICPPLGESSCWRFGKLDGSGPRGI